MTIDDLINKMKGGNTSDEGATGEGYDSRREDSINSNTDATDSEEINLVSNVLTFV